MTQQIRTVVIAALDRVAGVMNIPATARALMAGQDMAFCDVEIDSLSYLEIVMQIEDALGVELDADEVAAQGSVDGLVRFLQHRIAARQATV
jgi:Phosphopantetheine attachment site